MNNLKIHDLVTHFGLAWYFHLAQGGKAKSLNGFARSWLRRVRHNYTDERAALSVSKTIGAKYPGEALLSGLTVYLNNKRYNNGCRL